MEPLREGVYAYRRTVSRGVHVTSSREWLHVISFRFVPPDRSLQWWVWEGDGVTTMEEVSLDTDGLFLLVEANMTPDGILGEPLEPPRLLCREGAGPGDEWELDEEWEDVARVVDAGDIDVAGTALDTVVIERHVTRPGGNGPAFFLRVTETRDRRTGLVVHSRLERWFVGGADEPPDTPPDHHEELELLSPRPQ